ncbi:LLM class flavin-dependent oxidoreductase [Mycobacterium sp.]|uniref:LLM class flavin-dependent oxidoreductase n=1 Tax=Mycobacterium sp. TaxID=1785 RepID=UPI003D0E224F
MASVVEAAREALGSIGVCLPASLTVALDVDLQRDAIRRLDHAGYRTVWVNEVIGKDAFVQIGTLIAETERMVFGTSIANIWARPPQTMHAAAAQLAQAYPGRLVVGIGVGYPEQAASVAREFGRPLVTIRDYVQRMDEPTWPPVPDAAYPRIIAANGPKMLALADEIADGAFPAGKAPGFTAHARSTLGPDKLLVVGLSLDPDPTAVRDGAREHLNAGADHVTILPPLDGDFRDGIDQLELIAPTLIGLGQPRAGLV